jgi:two-component system OmpR family sensor kinase
VKIAPGTLVPPQPRDGGPDFGDTDFADTDFGKRDFGDTDSGSTNPGNTGATATVAAGAGTAAAGPVPAVVLDVADDGPGMTPDQAERAFERFYRADAARNRASGGTGLGLAIVAGLVAAHGGTVAIRTAPGQGADFEVRLPLSPDALAADPDDD